MNVFSETASDPKTHEAEQVRRTIRQAFERIEASLEVVRSIFEKHGPGAVRSALGADSLEVDFLYRALRGVVITHRPGSEIPDLPPDPE